MHARVLLLLVMALSGCSISGVTTDWVADDVAGPEPMNYRAAVAGGLSGILGSQDTPSKMLQISTPRRADTSKGATWVICLQLLRLETGSRAYYSVFLQRDRMIESRLSVGADQCESETYMPFDWAAETARPPVR